MMAFLECSEKPVYDTEPLCFAYKSYDEESRTRRPTSHTTQKDSNEFLMDFKDEIEKHMSEKTRKFLL